MLADFASQLSSTVNGSSAGFIDAILGLLEDGVALLGLIFQ